MAGVKGLQRKGFILCINHDKSKGSLSSKPEYDSVYAQVATKIYIVCMHVYALQGATKVAM